MAAVRGCYLDDCSLIRLIDPGLFDYTLRTFTVVIPTPRLRSFTVGGVTLHDQYGLLFGLI